MPTPAMVCPEELAVSAFARLPVGRARPLRGAAATHLGYRRTHNEDAWLARPAEGLFAVADGMGGHAAGEVASALCVAALSGLRVPRRGARAEALRAAIDRAHAQIVQTGLSEPEQLGMGTTVAAVWMAEDHAILAHVGDSRIYRLRDGHLERLTLDHSLLGDAVRAGWLTPAQVARQPPSCVITRALGGAVAPEVELGRVDLAPHDRLLLCSDGLTDLVGDGLIQRALRSHPAPGDAACALLQLALGAGGLDNVTVLVVDHG